MVWIGVFACGAALLIFSAEKLIGCLVGVASALRVSVFLLAIVFTGIEFDDVFLGVALNLEDVEDVALGVVVGTAISMTGVVLALAAILTPTEVSIPRDYLAAFALAPVALVAVVLAAPLGPLDGLALLGLFAAFICYVVVRETRGDRPVFRDAELYEAYEAGRAPAPAAAPCGGPAGRAATATAVQARRSSGGARLGLALLALAGLILGAWTTGAATEGILHAYGLEGTLFGATIATAVLTVEDAFLTVEPARKGVPEIGVANVIGSVVFSVTGKLGIILLAGGLVVGGSGAPAWHVAALAVLTWYAAYVLWTGRLRRRHGYLLLAFYIAYWLISFRLSGTSPVELG